MMLARRIIFFLSSLATVCLASTSIADDATESTEQFVGYVEDPNHRGTTSLVLSCVLTMVLCVWSVLHLNVPDQHETRLQHVLLNARWIIAGIYAPELVVFTAWRQWCSARILQKLVAEEEKESRAKSSAAEDKGGSVPEWTMTHSFFACTGGFALEIEGLELEEPPKKGDDSERQGPRRLTLTARGVALLARCGHLPLVSREEIADKSKANDLAKATVIVQATWMLVQTIGRVATGLPVTLLEVNTVAHVLCALGMYAFWWNKPLLPKHPIILRDPGLAELAAYMYSSSEMSGYVDPDRVRSQTVVKTLFAHLSLYSKVPEIETICLRPNNSSPAQICADRDAMPIKTTTVTETKVNPTTTTTTTNPIQVADCHFEFSSPPCLASLAAQRQKDAGTAFFERRPRVLVDHSPDSPLSAATSRRHTLIHAALTAHATLLLHPSRIALAHTTTTTAANTTTDSSHQQQQPCTHLHPEQLVAPHVQNWPSADLLRNVDGLVVGAALWLANLAYGAVHAAAWREHFPSEPEKWLWRASASYVAFCGGLWVALNAAVARSARLNAYWDGWMDGARSAWQSLALGCVVFVCGLSLVLARVFIVVEALVSIREVPEGAYRTAQWADVFPHF